VNRGERGGPLNGYLYSWKLVVSKKKMKGSVTSITLFGGSSLRMCRPDRTIALAFCSQGAIERLERRVGIMPIRRVQRILRVVLIGWIERDVGVVPIRWVDRITGIEAVRRVEGIVWRLGLCRVQRIIRYVPTGWIKDIVIALVLFAKAWFGKRRCSGDEQRQKKEEDYPHGEPPTSGTTSGLSLLPASPPGDQHKQVGKGFSHVLPDSR
jgi:hypothetical protein